MLPPLSLEHAINRIVREEWGRLLAVLTKAFGDLDLAEDCLHDAVETALSNWRDNGLPKSPAAWLLVAARRKALDQIRHKNIQKRKHNELLFEGLPTTIEPDLEELDKVIPDKRLELIFTCCHPSLDTKTKVALTLRTIGGLSTDEIAKSFLDKTETIAQRLARAKKKIRLAGIPYQVPDRECLKARINDVLSVIYLIFNEGYAATKGKTLTRIDLIEEAIRLGRIAKHLLPDDTEVAGLLALMLLHDARRHARLNEKGEMIALENQPRTRWDKSKIEEGTKLIQDTLKKQQVGPYQVQAAISALHNEASSWEKTDWAQINALYALLYQMEPTPVVLINRALALSYARSPQAGLDLLNTVEGYETYQAFCVTKSDLLRRCNQPEEARTWLARAIDLTDNEIEKSFLEQRLHRDDME